jgi:MYXO-CTERM domain-containing protein
MLPYRFIRTRASWLVPSLACLCISVSAHANGEPERPATWDMSLDELRAIGLGQSRGDPVPVPAQAQLRNADQPAAAPKQGVIFVNFDGANLSSGWDDSRTNTTQISQLAGPFAAYGEGPKREAVMQAVRENWAAYNFIVTDTRPASGDYTMNMTGPTNPFGGGVLGVAPLDCEDAQTHNNITFAFHSANDQFSATVQATTVSQEVAHSYGLEHVDEPGDIMNPYNAGGNASFIDACIQIAPGPGGSIQCQAQHAAECGTGTQQNAHRELLTMFGPSTPDTQPPDVQIVSPNDGDVFDEGASFDIQVVATDDTAVDYVELFNEGQSMGTDAQEPYGWSVSDIPKGVYEMHVLAYDLAGNVGMSNVVTVTVGIEALPDEDDGDGSSDGGSSHEGGSGSVPSGDDADADGCSCRQGGPSPWLAGLLSFGLLGVRRRAMR